MISIEVFLLGLLVTSTLTGLVTEAIKKIMIEYDLKYRANTLAGIVSIILSLGLGLGYITVVGIDITSSIIVCLIAIVLMSWLCAMVGYDKVIQAISQFKTTNKEE